jgi:GINS complex subunit 1
LERIRDLRWVKGSVLSESDQLNMTDNEIEYFTKYNKILANYMRNAGAAEDSDGLDLTENLKPPKCSMIFVSCFIHPCNYVLWINIISQLAN